VRELFASAADDAAKATFDNTFIYRVSLAKSLSRAQGSLIAVKRERAAQF
jgi:hypothetical protein